MPYKMRTCPQCECQYKPHGDTAGRPHCWPCELRMSAGTLTFTLPDESHEFKAAANAGALQAAIQDLERLLRNKDKYGTAQDKALTAEQVRGLLREVLRDHDAEWALD